MKKWGVWLVLAAITGMAVFLVVGCPSPEPIPEEPEKVTETKPEDINTVMERWSKDLGVKCTYCHTADDKGNLTGYTDKGKPGMRWASVSREFGVECGFCHTPEPPGGQCNPEDGVSDNQSDVFWYQGNISDLGSFLQQEKVFVDGDVEALLVPPAGRGPAHFSPGPPDCLAGRCYSSIADRQLHPRNSAHEKEHAH